MLQRLLMIILVSSLLTSCTQPDRATRILQEQGFTEIQTHPYGVMTLFACSEDDTFRTPFTAKGANGNIVNGTVCSGLFKGATVRFN